jgi:anti-sigma regulatory factor (Ser/Thr protein kinase)
MPHQIAALIDFNHISSQHDLLEAFTQIPNLKPGDKLELQVDLNGTGFIYPDLLLLLVARIECLKRNGIEVICSMVNFNRNSSRVNYASRINFFEILGIELEEGFTRRDREGRFIEISEFNETNINTVFEEIMRILIVNGVNEDMLTVLNFCLYEVLDNTLNHSSPEFRYGAGKGFVVAQFFPTSQEIRIIIADTGQGIHAALIGHPKSRFIDLSEPEAVSRCIERGVTNSLRLGFGLWATSEMMSKNKGDFIIYSGNSCLRNGTLSETPKWNGTINYLRINTNIPVDHKEIFGKDSDQLDIFQEFKESQFGNLENLW